MSADPGGVRVLKDISPTSWEHPADRAALQALRALPGFDLLLKKAIGFLGELGIRAWFQADAVRVGPQQLPRLQELMNEVCRTLDWPEEVPVFVAQDPQFNAGAYGRERPFIVLHSVTLDVLTEPELRVVLAHELAHIMSGHALYRTLLALLLDVGFRRLPFVAEFAFTPIRMALLEWSRKSELSCDRAGLLAAHSADDALSLLMQSAGGTVTRRHALNLEAYKAQVRDAELVAGIEGVFQLLHLAKRTHPFHTLRAAELLRWGDSEEYRQILQGNYRRRSQDGWRSTVQDLGSAAEYYAGQARQGAGEAGSTTQKAAEQASEYARRFLENARGVARHTADSAKETAEGLAARWLRADRDREDS
jgi:Zn-dependent protease with chaperone function